MTLNFNWCQTKQLKDKSFKSRDLVGQVKALLLGNIWINITKHSKISLCVCIYIYIYIFSSLHDDERLDDIEPKRVVLDESIYVEPLASKEFTESAIIFDDVDVTSDKRIRDAAQNLLKVKYWGLEGILILLAEGLITFHLTQTIQDVF